MQTDIYYLCTSISLFVGLCLSWSLALSINIIVRETPAF